MNSSKDFIIEYLSEAKSIIDILDIASINKFVFELGELRNRKGRLFILGIGGSSSNASHAVNDFRKIAELESYTATDNVSEFSALINDVGWENSFSHFLRNSNLNSKDAIMILSVGGGSFEPPVSRNLIESINYAKTFNSKIFSITGRREGFAYNNSDFPILVPGLYEGHLTAHTESITSVILHLIVMHPILQKQKTTW